MALANPTDVILSLQGVCYWTRIFHIEPTTRNTVVIRTQDCRQQTFWGIKTLHHVLQLGTHIWTTSGLWGAFLGLIGWLRAMTLYHADLTGDTFQYSLMIISKGYLNPTWVHQIGQNWGAVTPDQESLCALQWSFGSQGRLLPNVLFVLRTT